MEIKLEDYEYLKHQAQRYPIFARALNEYECSKGSMTQYDLLIGLIKVLADAHEHLQRQVIKTIKTDLSLSRKLPNQKKTNSGDNECR